MEATTLNKSQMMILESFDGAKDEHGTLNQEVLDKLRDEH